VPAGCIRYHEEKNKKVKEERKEQADDFLFGGRGFYVSR
jgi:hypothetical protein